MHSSFRNNRIFSKSNNALLAPSFHGNGCRMIAPFGSRSFSTGRKVSDKKYVGYWSGDFAQCLKRHFSGHASKETKKNPLSTGRKVKINMSSSSIFYVLQLKNGKKYVGYWSGDDLAQCLKRHFSGHASKETKKNPPYGRVIVFQLRVPKSYAQTTKYMVTCCFAGIYGPDLVYGARISRSYSISRELKRFAFENPLCRSVNAAVRKWLLAKGTNNPPKNNCASPPNNKRLTPG
jgi:predicted GIY-YIG superfamily endonuclease